MASLLPGMELAIELMRGWINDIRAQPDRPRRGRPPSSFFSLTGLKQGTPAYRVLDQANQDIERDRGYQSLAGLKPGTKEHRAVVTFNKRIERARKRGERNYGWPGTAEERSAEMKRRQAVARAKGKKSAAQTRWERMSQRQQKAHLAKMAAGRAAKQTAKHVNGAAA
jgi:hypothetical protein